MQEERLALANIGIPHMRTLDAPYSSTSRTGRFNLTDDEIALSFSIYFTWGYPDYVRDALDWLLKSRPQYSHISPDRDLPYRQLRLLLDEADSREVRSVIASRPHTSPSILNFLAQSRDPSVVLCVAENPRTHVATLTRLIRHHSSVVRIAVAEHPSTPEPLLCILARDEDADVRYALAENANMPKTVLQFLAQDDNPYVCARAQRTIAESESTPAQVVTANFKTNVRRLRTRG